MGKQRPVPLGGTAVADSRLFIRLSVCAVHVEEGTRKHLPGSQTDFLAQCKGLQRSTTLERGLRTSLATRCAALRLCTPSVSRGALEGATSPKLRETTKDCCLDLPSTHN